MHPLYTHPIYSTVFPFSAHCPTAVTMDRFVQNERLACCLLAAGFLELGQLLLLQLRQKHNE